MIDLSRAFRGHSALPKRTHCENHARRSLVVAAMLAIAVSAPAYADANDAVATAPETSPATDGAGRWFGWQVALVDLGSIALIAGGGALTSTSTGFAALPILGGATYLFPRGQQACAAVFGAVAGFGVGMVGAMVTDWITAREPAAAPSNAVTWSVTPLAVNGGHGIGVLGAF